MEGLEEIVERTIRFNVQENEEWASLLEDPSIVTEFSLVDRLLTRKPLNKKLMATILGRIWGVDTGWSLKILDQKDRNCYIALFFKDKEMLYWVVEKRPWMLNGGLLLVEHWQMSREWENARLHCYSCWGKAYGIPLKLLSEENIRQIVNSTGDVLEINFDSAKASFWGNFIQFKVEINVDRAICPSRFVPGEGKAKWVQFKFEKLPFMCFKCGMIGHKKANCEKPMLMVADSDGKDIPVLRPWLKMENTIIDCFEAAKVSVEGPGKKPWQERYLDKGSKPKDSSNSDESIHPGMRDRYDDIFLFYIGRRNVEKNGEISRLVGTSSSKKNNIQL
ncbi:hypothetical protein UlMin_039656 [Ulmus minor]